MTEKEICGEPMNDGDVFVIRCGLDKKHTTNHMAVISWGFDKKNFSYSIKELLLNADIVLRLREETKNLEKYLMHHANEMPPETRRFVSLKLIDFQKILKGKDVKDEKPDD